MESIVKRLRREREEVERVEKLLFEQLNTTGLQFDALIQRSDGWYNARNKRLTASNFGTICELSPHATARSLWQLMSGLIEDERNLNNDVHVNRGKNQESLALKAYSRVTKNLISDTGFHLLPVPHEYLGASPDAMIEDGKGLVEIKCPARGHFERIPDEYMAQIQGQLAICHRQYCDFCSFHTRHGIRIWRVQASTDYW